jgi:hypothetical protein
MEKSKEELEEIAKKFREEHNIKKEFNPNSNNDHYLVEMMRIVAKSSELLADDKNQAFSQLNMGSKLSKMFESIDETKEFALSYNYALHPLDEIQNDLKVMGISLEEPINFQVDILKEFIDEWMRKRVPANRLRVKEFIDLNTNVKEMMNGNISPASIPTETGQSRRRLF